MHTPFELDFVRRQFPALQGEWTFLDNAGGSQVPQSVADAVRDYLLHSNVQLGATYAVSADASARVAAGAGAAATLLGAAGPHEVVLGSSTTSLLATFARSLVGSVLGPGDEVIVTRVDHEANIGPWRRLAGFGIQLKEWPLDPLTQALEPSTLAGLLTPRTRLVAFTHASNLLGTLHDVAAVSALAHAQGALVVVDGVAFAPHRLVDVQALGVDAYAVSLYKVYAPHLAALYVRGEILTKLQNLNHFFFGTETAAEKMPTKLQLGGPGYEAVAALPAAVGYLESLGEHAAQRAGGPLPAGSRGRLAAAFEAIAAHEEELSRRLLDFFHQQHGVTVYGHPTPERSRRVPTVSFSVAGRDSAEIVRRIDQARIGLRYGHFYAHRLVEDLGLHPQNGVVRVSAVHYNTAEEIDRLIGELAEELSRPSKPLELKLSTANPETTWPRSEIYGDDGR